MIGIVTTEEWRTVALEIDGVPQVNQAGTVTERATARFAWSAEAHEWIAAMAAEGYSDAVIASAAVSYFGPTDAPGNCWSVTVERVAE